MEKVHIRLIQLSNNYFFFLQLPITMLPYIFVNLYAKSLYKHTIFDFMLSIKDNLFSDKLIFCRFEISQLDKCGFILHHRRPVDERQWIFRSGAR